MNIIGKIFLKWLPFAIVTAGLCGLVYIAVQQSLRTYANDPQIQIAEDASGALQMGEKVESWVAAPKIDIAASLAPFTMVFDEAGNVRGSSAELHGENPSLPPGVLDYARQNGENRVTWQPEAGVRIAAVIVAYKGGYVLVGRSLKEIEKRENQVELMCGMALSVTWFFTLIIIGLEEIILRRGKA